MSAIAEGRYFRKQAAYWRFLSSMATDPVERAQAKVKADDYDFEANCADAYSRQEYLADADADAEEV